MLFIIETFAFFSINVCRDVATAITIITLKVSTSAYNDWAQSQLYYFSSEVYVWCWCPTDKRFRTNQKVFFSKCYGTNFRNFISRVCSVSASTHNWKLETYSDSNHEYFHSSPNLLKQLSSTVWQKVHNYPHLFDRFNWNKYA